MQLLLVICLLGVALAAPSERQKRDILPGDPRYGTDYHLHHHDHSDHHDHHEHHHENQVEARTGGRGFSDSYASEASKNFNNAYLAPRNEYGPPNFIPGKPIVNNQYLSPVVEASSASQSSFNSYGAPVPSFKAPENQKLVYNAPVFNAPKPQAHNYASSPSVEIIPAISSSRTEHEIVKSAHEETKNSAEVHNTHVKTNSREESSGAAHASFSGVKGAPAPGSVDSSHYHGISHGPSESFGASGHSHAGFPSGLDASAGIRAGFDASSGFGYYGGLSGFPSGFDSGITQGFPVRTIDTHVPVDVSQPYTVQITRTIPYPYPVAQPVQVPRQWYLQFIPQPSQIASFIPSQIASFIPSFPGADNIIPAIQGSGASEQPAESSGASEQASQGSVPDQKPSEVTPSVESATDVEASAAKAPSHQEDVPVLIPGSPVLNRQTESVNVGAGKTSAESSSFSGSSSAFTNSQQLVDANGAYIY